MSGSWTALLQEAYTSQKRKKKKIAVPLIIKELLDDEGIDIQKQLFFNHAFSRHITFSGETETKSFSFVIGRGLYCSKSSRRAVKGRFTLRRRARQGRFGAGAISLVRSDSESHYYFVLFRVARHQTATFLALGSRRTRIYWNFGLKVSDAILLLNLPSDVQ